MNNTAQRDITVLDCNSDTAAQRATAARLQSLG